MAICKSQLIYEVQRHRIESLQRHLVTPFTFQEFLELLQMLYYLALDLVFCAEGIDGTMKQSPSRRCKILHVSLGFLPHDIQCSGTRYPSGIKPTSLGMPFSSLALNSIREPLLLHFTAPRRSEIYRFTHKVASTAYHTI